MEQNADTGAQMTSAVDKKQKSGNGLKIATVIACVVAVCGIGFGIYGMFFHETKTSDDDSLKNVSVTQEGDGNTIVQKELPSIETITGLLKDKYKLFDQDSYTPSVGTILSDYIYNDDSEGLDDTGKLFLLVKQEYPNPGCEDVRCHKTITYNDLNNKYHEYYGNSEDIKKGINYTYKNIMIGVENIEYIEGDDSFEITYPNAIGGRNPSSGYYTNIIDTERVNEGSIAATAIVTKVDAENAKLYGTGSCLEVSECPYIDMNTLVVKSSLYEYVFVEEDGLYKLTDIVEQ